jgi:glycosyltransferase involved in cell wall biosynthesis
MISLDVIVPFYGDPRFLVRAVNSVRALLDTDWQMTIIEDCYPDGPAVEQQIDALGDKRITYTRNERNLGVAGNQHRSMEIAERDFFVVLDADDLLLPNYGQQVARLIDRYPNAGLIQPGVEVVDEDDRPYRLLPDRAKSLIRPARGEFALGGEEAAASLLRGNWLYTPALTYRRDISRNLTHRSGTDAVNDLSMVIDILLRGGLLVVGGETAFRYRRHRHSHSSTAARTGLRFAQERAFFTAIEAELRERGWHTAARAARWRMFSRLNAITQVPGALMARQGAVVRALLNHALH